MRKYIVLALTVLMLLGLIGGVAVAEEPCERYGQGYWRQWLGEKAEEDPEWKCGAGFTAGELLDMLNTPARGDANVILSYHFIAAALNTNPEANDPPCTMPPTVAGAFGAAYNHLIEEEGDSGATRQEILGWKDILEFWNENKYAELESVEYVGTCNEYGSHLGETLTLTFSNDVSILFNDQELAQTRIEFENAYRLGHNPNYMEWVADGNQVTITVVGTFGDHPTYGARPEVGDLALTLRGIVDFINEPAVVPEGGVEVVKVGGKCLVETVMVDSANMAGADSAVLESGQQYMFKVSGTWTNRTGTSTEHEVDAAYVSFDNWATPLPGYPDRDTRLLELQVNKAFIDWGEYNQDHIYELGFIGEDEVVNFRVFDGDVETNEPIAGWYNDNEGSLTVEIYKVW